MSEKNLLCGRQLRDGRKCDGELILVDGNRTKVRLHCQKCEREVPINKSLEQYLREKRKAENALNNPRIPITRRPRNRRKNKI